MTQKTVSECLEYLAETDERLGVLKASADYYKDYKAKQVKAEIFLSKTGTKDERESEALCSASYLEVMDAKRQIDTELQIIIAKRKTCELTIEVWRSQQANRRQGNITNHPH